MFGGREFQFGLGTYWHFCPDGTLEVGIEALFRIQFGAVAGQVEQLDLVLTFSGPCLDRFAVMDLQVVENQEHLLVGILNQRFKEFDQLSALKASSMIIQRVLP